MIENKAVYPRTQTQPVVPVSERATLVLTDGREIPVRIVQTDETGRIILKITGPETKTKEG